MNKILSVNHIILNPKEYNGQRVVTFKDIDLVRGRAEGTARKRFADNKDRFIEGVDYFLVTPQSLENTEMSEKRTSGIDSVNARGTIFVTESGYLLLIKSFTDDLAWAVQRELVNHYFRTQKEKVEPQKLNHEMVVDIPVNPEFQKVFMDIRKNTAALDVLTQCLNRYVSQEDADAYIKAIDGVGINILKLANSFRRMRYKLIPKSV